MYQGGRIVLHAVHEVLGRQEAVMYTLLIVVNINNISSRLMISRALFGRMAMQSGNVNLVKGRLSAARRRSELVCQSEARGRHY